MSKPNKKHERYSKEDISKVKRMKNIVIKLLHAYGIYNYAIKGSVSSPSKYIYFTGLRKTFDYDESHEYLEVPYIRISNHYKYILSNTVFEILVIDDPLEFVDPYEEQRLIDWLVNMKVLNEGDLVRNDQEL